MKETRRPQKRPRPANVEGRAKELELRSELVRRKQKRRLLRDSSHVKVVFQVSYSPQHRIYSISENIEM